MSYKMKYRFFHVLFQLFAYLADQTGGWKMFVRPKLLLGSMIIGLGVAAYGQNTENRRPLSKKAEGKVDSIRTSNEKNVPQDSLYIKQDNLNDSSINRFILCYVPLEVAPQFPGGEFALRKWVSENIHYPEEAQGKGIQGEVYCRFVVTEDGTVADVEVIKGIYPELDAEAICVIKRMPRWIPAKQNGKPVRVGYSLPINFRLAK